MTRQEVEDCVTVALLNWGRGFSYDAYVNGEVRPSIQWVRDNAEEGDEVRVEIYTTGKYQYHRRTVRFDIKPLTESQEKMIREKRERERSEYDYQKQRFFNFEMATTRSVGRKMGGREIESEEEAEEIVEKAWEWVGINEPKPSVEITNRLSRSSYYYPPGFMRTFNHHIGLAEGWGQDKTVLLHEIAHAVMRKHHGHSNFPAHGEDFAAVTIALWAEFLDGYDAEDLTQTANEAWSVDVNEDFKLLNE